MSGYPTTDKVRELREAIRELRESDANLQSLNQMLAECKANLPKAEDRASTAMRELFGLLREMDCASTGNHGWENRFATLLIRLDEQASEPEP